MRPNFKSFILVPKRGKAEALRKLLGGLCADRTARLPRLARASEPPRRPPD